MGRSYRHALFLPLVLICASGQAQIYMCKDASGHTLTSDRPIAECADRAVRELDSRGLARREISPPPTAEQKRQMQIELEKRKAEAAAADEQKREDRAITMRYRSEADIESARKRSLEIVQEQVKREKTALAAAEQKQKSAQAEAESYQKKKVPVPPAVQRKAEDADRGVTDANKLLQNAEAESERINTKFDETVKRYRELVGATASR